MQLQLQNVSKKYGTHTALDGFSFTFEPGIYGILGANGAGKSTMMNLLTDNLPRTNGAILYKGTDIQDMGERFRQGLV